MKGFKDSTKTQYAQGGSSCYAKGGAVKGAAKVAKVMGEFKKGELHSGSKKGPVVTSPKQATAIAMSEARAQKAGKPVKKGLGGVLKALSPAYQIATSDVGQKLLGSGALGVGGMLLKDLMKKKQSGGTLTPAEEKQVAAAGPQTAMKKGGKVVKKARGGGIDDAVARGNRMQELEAREEAPLVREGQRKAAREAKQGNPYLRSEPKETIVRETITRSAPMVPIRRGPNGAGYKNNPLIPDMIEGPLRSMGVIGRKAGGLSAMPKGKK